MRRGFIGIGILVGFLFAMLLTTGAFAKDVVEFSPPNGKVTFNHKKHAETLKNDCLKCHHTWKQGETSGQLCKECHKAKAEGKALAAKDAFHQNCKGCHDEAKKANKAAGPTGCTQCHVKGK